MADAPAAAPAAVPVAAPPTGIPPVSAAPPTPAAAPPAGKTTQAAPELDFETPIEYDDGKGGVKTATLGELVQARERLTGLGDVNQYQDLIAAMNNDPAATERVLRKQLADIEAAKAKQTPQGNAEVESLRKELAEIKALLQDSTRVTTTIQTQQDQAILENLLGKAGVKEKLPYLAYNTKEGAKIAHAFVQAYKKQVTDAGQQWTNHHLLQALSAAEAKHKSMLAPYGVDPTKPAAAPGSTPVSAVNNGRGSANGVVREALETPESLLRGRYPMGVTPQPQPVGSNIPEAGGAVGGAPLGPTGNPANQRYDSQGLLQKIKARHAAGGGS